MLRNYGCLLCRNSFQNVLRRTIWSSSRTTTYSGQRITHFHNSQVSVNTLQKYSRPTLSQKLVIRRCHAESMPLLEYTDIVSDTLEDLADQFDYLADEGFFDQNYDCTLADGVMTVNLGKHGIYVINKQTPNRQIWLSSPVSGPKRYDFMDDAWVYSHEAERTLHDLLTNELSEVLGRDVDFSQLNHGKRTT